MSAPSNVPSPSPSPPSPSPPQNSPGPDSDSQPAIPNSPKAKDSSSTTTQPAAEQHLAGDPDTGNQPAPDKAAAANSAAEKSPQTPTLTLNTSSHAKVTSPRQQHHQLPSSPLSPQKAIFYNSFQTPTPQLTTVSEDWQNFTAGVREKASAAFSSISVKAKSSANSLRARTPQGAHVKTVSTSTFVYSPSRQVENHLSSQSSDGTQSSPASSISQGDEATVISITTKNPEAEGPEAIVDRPSVDLRQSTDRGAERGPTRRNPSPAAPTGSMISPHNKMHQTSSRLLRMTDEERPFTRDFKDLFSTLMVSLPLSSHRVRFQKIDHTFTSEEAINNLGSLKFSQSNRMPDPKDPSRIVTTTTTTTFSMAKEMARSVCQRFMEARFIESADGKSTGVFPLKGALWQMTPKGMHVLSRFCQRNGINQRHIVDVLDSPRNTMQLVILERDGTSDKLSHDRATVEVLFRRFVGQRPNVKNSTQSADSDSVADYRDGLVGVKMASSREISGRNFRDTFTGKAAVDWLMDCCTTVDRRETYEIAELFFSNGLITCVAEDKAFARQNLNASRFQATKDAIYSVTEKGQKVAGWVDRTPSPDSRDTVSSRSVTASSGSGSATTISAPPRSGPRDSNNNRLLIIVNDPALRLLFREYLRDTHCEENLAFYLEVRDFTKTYDNAARDNAFKGRLDAIRENLAAAYGLYNAFLAPGSPCELNIDHNLRNSLAGRMTRAVGDDDSMLKSLEDVVSLFKEAQTSVFKLMSSDSVPKFLKEPKYVHQLREHNFDPTTGTTGATQTLPERSLSSRLTPGPRAPLSHTVPHVLKV